MPLGVQNVKYKTVFSSVAYSSLSNVFRACFYVYCISRLHENIQNFVTVWLDRKFVLRQLFISLYCILCVCVFAHLIGCLVFISAYFIIIKKTEKYQIFLFSRLQTSASRRSCAAQNNKTNTNKTRALVLTTKSNRETTHKTCASF